MWHFFPSLVHLQTSVCDCQNITREKLTNTQNLMEVTGIPNSYEIIIFRGLRLHIPYATIFHVFLAPLKQSCLSQCRVFQSPISENNHSLIVLSTSLHEAWISNGYTEASGLKIILGRRARESVEQSRATKAWLTYSKVQKAITLLAAFTACCFNYPSQGNP